MDDVSWVVERLEKLMPGGATTHIFLRNFHPYVGGNDGNLTHICFKWVGSTTN